MTARSAEAREPTPARAGAPGHTAHRTDIAPCAPGTTQLPTARVARPDNPSIEPETPGRSSVLHLPPRLASRLARRIRPARHPSARAQRTPPWVLTSHRNPVFRAGGPLVLDAHHGSSPPHGPAPGPRPRRPQGRPPRAGAPRRDPGPVRAPSFTPERSRRRRGPARAPTDRPAILVPENDRASTATIASTAGPPETTPTRSAPPTPTPGPDARPPRQPRGADPGRASHPSTRAAPAAEHPFATYPLLDGDRMAGSHEWSRRRPGTDPTASRHCPRQTKSAPGPELPGPGALASHNPFPPPTPASAR